MKFLITRVSNWGSKPCKEAQRGVAVRIDRRTVSTLAEARKTAWGEHFFARGVNHREENGMIARDLEEEAIWTIEINTLEELMALEAKYGDLVISSEDSWLGYTHEIEIYDSYRE